MVVIFRAYEECYTKIHKRAEGVREDISHTRRERRTRMPMLGRIYNVGPHGSRLYSGDSSSIWKGS